MDQTLVEQLLLRNKKPSVNIGEGLRALGYGLGGKATEYRPIAQNDDNTVENYLTKELIERNLPIMDSEQADIDYKKALTEKMKNGQPVPDPQEEFQRKQDLMRLQADLDKEMASYKAGLPDPLREARIKEIKQRIEILGKPQSQGIPAVPEGFEITEYKQDRDGNRIPVIKKIQTPQDKQLTAETAGKLSMVSQAEQDLNEAEALLFPNGKFDPNMAFNMNFPGGGMPLSEGRTAYSKILNAVNAKLRIETGAQANPSEVQNILQRFAPTMRDSDLTAKDKIRRLKEFVSNTRKFLDPAGKYGYESMTPTKYQIGQIIGNYKVIGGDLNNDPDVEPIR